MPLIDPSAGKFVSAAKEGKNLPSVPAKMQTNPPEKVKHAGEGGEHDASQEKEKDEDKDKVCYVECGTGKVCCD